MATCEKRLSETFVSLADTFPYALALAAFVAVTDLKPAVGATIGALAAVAVAAFTGIPRR